MGGIKEKNGKALLFLIPQEIKYLNVLAHQAYQSYVREYGLRNGKIFDVLALNIIDLAKSFGLSGPPKMTVQVRKNKKYKTVTMRLKTNKWADKEDNYDL